MTRDVSRELALDASAVVVTLALLVAIGAGVAGPVRVVLALAFVTFVPGWALLDRVPLAEGASKVALAIPLSFAIGGGAATLLAMFHRWEPLLLFFVLGATSVVLIVSHAIALRASVHAPTRPA